MALARTAKTTATAICSALGVNRVLRAKLKRHLLVLCYHGVVQEKRSDRFGYGNTVSAEEFRGHLALLTTNFQPVSLADVIAHKSASKPLPPGAALVTFDDGYRNNLTLAAPLLRAAGVPAVFFLTTAYIGTQRVLWTDDLVGRIIGWRGDKLPLWDGTVRHLPPDIAGRRTEARSLKDRCKGLPQKQVSAWVETLRADSPGPAENAELYGFMDWNEVRELQRQGFDLGSHTVNHPILTRIGPERLDRELVESKQTIERELRSPCVSVAYPNGGAADVSKEVFDAARRAGYSVGFTVSERHSPPGEDALSVSRLCIQGHLDIADFTWRVDGLQRLATFGAGA